MKQWEAVVLALERLGGQATLAELYQAAMKIEGCSWRTRTPFASIRRILQTRPEFVRLQPGLWALAKYANSRHRHHDKPIDTHAYYQGLLVEIGNWYGMQTYVPHSGRNKPFMNRRLQDICSMDKIPPCSYEELVTIIARNDVVWFNRRRMLDRFFEVEHTTDFRRSLLKFVDLQDFAAKMDIVAPEQRRREFEERMLHDAFTPVRNRVQFLSYKNLARFYEAEAQKAILADAL